MFGRNFANDWSLTSKDTWNPTHHTHIMTAQRVRLNIQGFFKAFSMPRPDGFFRRAFKLNGMLGIRYQFDPHAQTRQVFSRSFQGFFKERYELRKWPQRALRAAEVAAKSVTSCVRVATKSVTSGGSGDKERYELRKWPQRALRTAEVATKSV